MNKILSLLLMGLLWSCSEKNPEIDEWRGQGRSGKYPDTDLLEEWPEGGPSELWFLDGIGNGFGSPVIAGDRIYVTGELDSMATLHCIDLEGRPLWKAPFGEEWVKSFPGSRSAPTVVGNLVYVGSGMGNLYCLDKEDGSMVWSRDFVTDFQGEYPFHGHSEAAVVKGDKVFWVPGGKEYNVVALNRFSEELIWSHAGFSERSACNPSQLIELPERSLFVTFSAYHLLGFDTQTGALLWSHEQESYPPEQRKPGYGDTHANSVLYEDGSIFYAAGDGNCGVKLDLKDDGSGQHFSHPVIDRGILYQRRGNALMAFQISSFAPH